MEYIRQNIEDRIRPILDRAGIYYRIFSRVKSKPSIEKKLSHKENEYRQKGKKMQDIIGIRIVFYFQEDVEICHERMKKMDGYDSRNESNSSLELQGLSQIIESWDEADSDNKGMVKKLLPFHDKVFMPERLNLVMRMTPEEQMFFNTAIQEYGKQSELIDATYEIQLRTVLSEGWHEVEHDLRYKTSNEKWWNFCEAESRMLNGIYASLETNERALSQMIQELAYKNYKHRSWDAMIRFHFRIRMEEKKLPDTLGNILDKDKTLAKKILHVKKQELTTWLWEIPYKLALTPELILFLLNRKCLNCPSIFEAENDTVKMVLGDYGQN